MMLVCVKDLTSEEYKFLASKAKKLIASDWWDVKVFGESWKERVPYPDIVAIKHRNVLIISVKYRSTLGTIYVSQDELKKMVDFARRSDGIMLIAIKVRELGDWRAIPLSASNILYSNIEKLTITVDMIRNAKKLEDWLREVRLL